MGAIIDRIEYSNCDRLLEFSNSGGRVTMSEPLVYPTKIYSAELTLSQIRDEYAFDFGYPPKVVFKASVGWIAGDIDESSWEEESEDG